MTGPAIARRLSVVVGSASVGNYAAIAVALLTNVVLTRAIGATEFGRLALLLMASQVSMLLVANWTLTAVVRFGAREHTEFGVVARTFWHRIVLLVPGVVVVAVVISVFAPDVATYLGIPADMLWLVALHFAIATAFATGVAVLQAVQRLARYGIALAADRAAGFTALLVAMQIADLDAVGALAMYTLGTAVASVWLFASIRRYVFVRIHLDRRQIVEFARFALPMIATTWAGLFGGQWIDLVIMRQFLPLSDIGVFALASQISGGAQQLTVVAGAVLLPRFSALVSVRDSAEIHAILEHVVPSWLLAYALGLGVLIALVEMGLPIVFGSAFAPAVPVLCVLLVASMVAGLFGVFQALLNAHGVVWPISLAVVLAVITNVVLDVLLIPAHGIVGSALATFGSYTVSASIALVAVQLRLGWRLARYALFVAMPLGAALSSYLFDGIILIITLVGSLALGSVLAIRIFHLTPWLGGSVAAGPDPLR